MSQIEQQENTGTNSFTCLVINGHDYAELCRCPHCAENHKDVMPVNPCDFFFNNQYVDIVVCTSCHQPFVTYFSSEEDFEDILIELQWEMKS